MEEICETCRWYTEFEGVCCNSDSPYRGGWPDNPEGGCAKWEEVQNGMTIDKIIASLEAQASGCDAASTDPQSIFTRNATALRVAADIIRKRQYTLGGTYIGIEFHEALCDRLKAVIHDREKELERIRKEVAQSNDPLTLEELREMEGAPVYIEFIHDRSMSCYRIIRSISDIDIDFIEYKYFDKYYSLSLGFYGRDWLAYRRKPEEVPA